MTLQLHIERLVVDGLSLGAHDGADLQAALHAQLTTLFAAQGVPVSASKSASLRSLACPSFESPPQTDGGVLGLRIAESLYAGLAHPGPPARD